MLAMLPPYYIIYVHLEASHPIMQEYVRLSVCLSGSSILDWFFAAVRQAGFLVYCIRDSSKLNNSEHSWTVLYLLHCTLLQ